MTSTWFERAVRPEHVATELRQAVPELERGEQELLDARMIRLRAADTERHWTATYLLDLLHRDGTRHTVSAHGLLVPPDAEPPAGESAAGFGGDGWRLWLPESRLLLRTWARDDSLPGLAALTDPASAREVLQQVLRASAPGRSDLVLEGATATVAAYKPGARVTLVCDLTYGDGPVPKDWPGTVVAKAHAGAEGEAVHAALQALWQSPLAASPHVTIAEPLGYVAGLGLSVQGYVEHERTLKDLLAEVFTGAGDPDPLPAVRATATALAALHTSGVEHGPVRSWDDELASQWRKHENLAAVVPWLAGHTEGVLARLQTAGGAVPAEDAVPSHGSFRTAQVLLTPGGRAGIIDVDKLRQAEPAADVGPFLAKLRHTAVNKGGDELPDEATAAARNARVDEVREAFLAAYREHAPLSPQRLSVWEGLEYLSLVLGSAKKGLPERAASCAAMLHRHLRDQDL